MKRLLLLALLALLGYAALTSRARWPISVRVIGHRGYMDEPWGDL